VVRSYLYGLCKSKSYINILHVITSTYDHRVWRTGLPVRSAVLKPHAGKLVVRWVTTSESLLLQRLAVVPEMPDECVTSLGAVTGVLTALSWTLESVYIWRKSFECACLLLRTLQNKPTPWLSSKRKHKFKDPRLVCRKAQTPVGSLSRTATVLHTHPFYMESNPQRFTVGLPALRVLPEEPMLCSTTLQSKRDAMDFARARDVNQIMRTLPETGEEVVTKVIELLRVRKDNLTMKLGLKELAKEVGVTPSYLCRVFKKTMGITVGTYLMEFEKESSEDGTESSARTPSQFGSDVSSGTGLTLPATEESLQVPFGDMQGGVSKEGVRNIAEALDLNFNFHECCANIDDQFWTEDYWTEDSWNAGFWNEGSLY
ncbi:hypothetical protein N7446_006969, partial [Penicillium canescens]